MSAVPPPTPTGWQGLYDSLYRDGPDIACMHNWRRFVVCHRRYWSPGMQNFVGNPDTAMSAGVMLKDGDSTTVVLMEMDGCRYVVKRYNIRNAWYALRRLFRPSRAWHCWRNAHQLLAADIRTPAPVLMLEQRWGPLRRKAYVLTAWVDGPDVLQYLTAAPLATPPLSEVLQSETPASEIPNNVAVWQQTLTLFRHLFENMKHLRLVHGDCKATNFIVSDGELYVLDLDAMRQERTIRGFDRYFQRDLRRFRANWRQDQHATALINGLFRELKVKVNR